MDDKRTVDYFDEHTPEYSLGRLRFATEFIRRHARADSTLADIGCGTGNILEHIIRETPVKNACGIDVSRKYLEMTQERVGCETLRGSILDEGFVRGVSGRFDFALLAAVLHHLVGRTRRESADFARRAIRNSLRLLKRGGHLIIVEPTFSPAVLADFVFYLKRFVTRFTSRRVQILGEWNNIGAPVVSYYTNKRLVEMIEESVRSEIVSREFRETKPSFPLHLVPAMRRTDTTIVSRKGKS